MVAAPAAEVPLLGRLAALLRQGGQAARRLREQLTPEIGNGPARSGAELVVFFLGSPLVAEALDLQRDRSPGRPAAP